MDAEIIKKAKAVIRDGNIPNKKFRSQCHLCKQAISKLRHHEITVRTLPSEIVESLAHFYDKCQAHHKL